MQSIEGRTTDVVLTPSGNRLVAQIFGHVLLCFPQVDEYQVVQEARDWILVRLLPKGEITAELQRQIVDTLHEVAADDLNIQIELVSEIPLPPTGKRRYVISKLAQGQTCQPC
jgi:phenylacetate-CoA ligase